MIDASDVPNNPIQQLVDALDLAASGAQSCVWWHLEPDSYFMHFAPHQDEITFTLSYAPGREQRPSNEVASVRGSRPDILLPFWRFLRQFQSHDYAEPHWPSVDYQRMAAIKRSIGA